MRLMIAENMVRAVSEAPHVTAVFEADFTAVAAHDMDSRGVIWRPRGKIHEAS
jgi:pyruvate/2-oxoglutarate dehydrogenase complex dihydrolipoamide acyltransferase (E2) component